jgi:hypothetical protein
MDGEVTRMIDAVLSAERVASDSCGYDGRMN